MSQDGAKVRQMMNPARRVELTITSDASSLQVVRAALKRTAELQGFSPDEAHDVALALDEALANVIKHGYGGPCNMPIHITFEGVDHDDGRPGLRLTVRDHGRQVDPCTIRGRNLDDVRPGGLGVHIMRTVMDEIEWSCPTDGGMLLRMEKYRKAPQPHAAAPPGGGRNS